MSVNPEGLRWRIKRWWGREWDRRRHACGCVTVFDCDAWTSVAVHRCPAHAPLDPNWPAP